MVAAVCGVSSAPGGVGDRQGAGAGVGHHTQFTMPKRGGRGWHGELRMVSPNQYGGVASADSFDANASSAWKPRSASLPSPCLRGETPFASTSLSPITSVYGIF